MPMIITIDGPAGTGKTTIARHVAEKLKFTYFDTGAMYRALTYLIEKNKIHLSDSEALSACLKDFNFEIKDAGNQKRYFVGNEDVTELIRTPQITQRVSEISANAEVRTSLVAVQREFGKGKNAVFEGRDMGTTVFPKAEVKFFLMARPSVRAERRYKEFSEKKMPTTQEEVFQELLERDHFDSTREVSPLKQAEDAHIIDTSDLSIEQVIEKMLALIPRQKP